MILKVCRITDIHSARISAEAGADFLGFHAIDELDPVRAESFRRIIREVRARFPQCKPVLVTKVQDPVKISKMLRTLDIDIIQIHTRVQPRQLTWLSRELSKNLRKMISIIAVVAAADEEAVKYARCLMKESAVLDIFLIDSGWRGGTGTGANQESLRELRSVLTGRPVILAGGLTASNVNREVRGLGFDGADVQTGVEVSHEVSLMKGQKDSRKILELARQLGKYQRGRLFSASPFGFVSLAVARLSLSELQKVLPTIFESTVDMIHLDESDGTIVSSLRTDLTQYLAELAIRASAIPVDLHLITRNANLARDKIAAYSETHGLIRTVYFHCRFRGDGAVWANRTAAWQRECQFRVGLAFDASGFQEETLEDELNSIEEYPIDDLTLVSRSAKYSTDEFASHEGSLMRILDRWSRGHPGLGSLGIDRDVSLARLRRLVASPPSNVISGKFLLAGKLEDRLRHIRELAAGGANVE